MNYSTSCFNTRLIFPILVLFFLLLSAVFPTILAEEIRRSGRIFRPRKESKKMKLVRDYLIKVNKPFVKSIQSPDGDIIDCVLTHQQPAFDDPLLKGTKIFDPPERPNGHNEENIKSKNYQIWSSFGEKCPQETIPIRRTTEEDILRADSIQNFGRKKNWKSNSLDSYSSLSTGHQHAIGFVKGGEYYGAKATINVWRPNVTNSEEFSLSQIWVLSGSFDEDLNTIEAGWQVIPQLYGDNSSRFFIYWTRDAYQTTGCYNLLCSGFVQTTHEIAVGAAIYPLSSYNGDQYEINITIWKDPKSGNWWLEFGSGILIGYWPAQLFTNLKDHATAIEFGGEVYDARITGAHTTTQMGSGHFPGEGFRKTSFLKNLEVMDSQNYLNPVTDLQLLAEQPNCYDVTSGSNDDWGNFIFYGGPGKNPKCP